MIDEKKIEEAANEYLLDVFNENVIGDASFKEYVRAFKAGINWLLENLWHDASEELEQMKNILIEFPNGNCYACYRSGNYYKTPNISDDRYDIIDAKDIKRWLYIEDLMKGGK